MDKWCAPVIISNNIIGKTATSNDRGGGISLYFEEESYPIIGGSDASDTDDFNTICGNTLPQVVPDEYPYNYICDECPCP